ncbi:MAG: oligosaccharide flippase family protein, partial [bacterium]|nr:oligosaccharide flippase family protein [bacterium]
MEKIFRLFGKEYGSLNQAALLLGVFSLLSQLLGLFRDRSLAHFLGASQNLDIYYAAFRVPDFLFISIASLASVTVLVPFVLHKMGDRSSLNEEAKKFLNDVFTIFLFVLIGVAILAFIFMPSLANLVAPGFTDTAKNEVVTLSRIMLCSPILLGLSNLFGAVTQIFRRFFSYALSPIFYNLGIIIGVVFLYPLWQEVGLAIGVVVGAFLHFLVQNFSAYRAGFVPKFQTKINFKEIKNVILVSLPRTLGLAFNSIAIIVIISFASYFEHGSISIFNFAYNLQTTPLGIIGLSYAVAAFPALSKSFSTGNFQDFKNNLRIASKAIIFWSLPVSFLFIVLRAQIVRVILGTGLFSWENTRLVAASLAIFSLSIVAQGLIALFAR